MFFTDLWDSIFTPGTTPALVQATHMSFMALVVVLALMLWATRSLHFVAMLVLSLALWWATTWFVREFNATHYNDHVVGKDGKVQELPDSVVDSEKSVPTEGSIEASTSTKAPAKSSTTRRKV